MCQTTTPMARLPFRSIAVSGESMSPTFNDGDWLLFRPIYARNTKHLPSLVGKVIVIERESYPGIHLIKRVTKIVDQGLWVEGDNQAASTDSRQWGVITSTELVGVVLLRYRKAKFSVIHNP